MDLAVALTAFLLVIPVELPDKTFIATLVLSTRYRALPTWCGVGLAFAVQSLVAVTLGGLVSRLPHRPVTAVTGLLFALGMVVLWRGSAEADAQEPATEAQFAGKVRSEVSGWQALGASFVVLFVAEWGDLSQLLTAGLVVRYRDPVSVFVGSWSALLLVSGLAALVGRWLIRRIRLATVRRVGGAVCGLLGAVTLLHAAGVATPF